MSDIIVVFHGMLNLNEIPRGYRVVHSNGVYSGEPPAYMAGYSIGCQHLRESLRANLDRYLPTLRGVLTVDGVHSTLPISKAHVDLWKKVARHARQGYGVWHNHYLRSHNYVERLPTPYASTATMAKALDLRLPDEAPRFVQFGHPSMDMDKEAHAYLGREFLNYFTQLLGVSELMARVKVESHYGYTLSGEAEVDEIVGKLASWYANTNLGTREIAGARSQPDILSFSEIVGRGSHVVGHHDLGIGRYERGSFLGFQPVWLDRPGFHNVRFPTDETEWCAAFASSIVFAAQCMMRTRTGTTPSWYISPKPSVREMCEDAREADRLFTDRSTFDVIPFGSPVILGRAGGNPLNGGIGHVRLFGHVAGNGEYHGVGGNENDRVQWAKHPLSEILAWIDISGTIGGVA